MRKPYFLTRQTANLMEDFARDLKAGSGVYLLYGDEGVGKTRLLEELVHSRLQDVKVRWVDLKEGGSGDGALVDSSVLIEDTFARAQPGDVIIADHFEMALKKTRHQLFLSWSTDGADKQINLIVAGNTGYFDEIRQFAQQYQLRVQSFQQMPFSHDEAETFLGFYLFPERPFGKLSVPPLLRNQITMAQGSVGKIVEIAERAGDQISSGPLSDTESVRRGSPVIIGVLVAGAVIFVGGWYLLGSQSQIDEMPLAEAGSSAIIQAPPQPEPEPAEALEDNNPAADTTEELIETAPDEAADETADSEEDSHAVSQGVKQGDGGEERAPAEAPVLAAETEEEVQIQVQAATASVDELRTTTPAVDELQSSEEQDVTVNDDLTPANVPQIEPESAPATAAVLQQSTQSESSRLQRDLQSSLDWINGRDSNVGTLQVMLVNQKRFDEKVYYEYVDRLISQDIDVSELRIFATYTGNQKVYSIVFGEFQTRSAANAAKAGLPKILQQAAPLPRSVGGLMTEIQQLEGKN